MKRYTRGFTLIELLVVIAIIGILASVVLVSLQSARKKGNDSRVISDVQQLRTQLESDYSGGVYPVTCSAAAAACSITTSNVGAPTNGAWGTSANYTTLATDAYGQNGDGLRIIGISSTPAAANGPLSAYAVFGRLQSDTTKFFCIDSKGGTASATGTPIAGVASCN